MWCAPSMPQERWAGNRRRATARRTGSPRIRSEAYVAMRINIDNWRWQGVPFYLRVGKQLPKKATEISVHFKRPPHVLFNRGTADDPANVLSSASSRMKASPCACR